MPVFREKICISGGLCSSFVFESKDEKAEWLTNTLPMLKAEYGDLTVFETELPALKVGDKCRVFGEGSEVFEIMGIKEYSPNRYGFLLDSGWWEEVAKCYEA